MLKAAAFPVPILRTELGRIQSVTFGWGGYQDVQLGINFKLGGQSWGVMDFNGYWGIERTERCEWTERDRDDGYSKTFRFIAELLKKAKKQTIDQLKDVPIEATFVGNTLKSWRILEEVL
jgi:hypothetical protein